MKKKSGLAKLYLTVLFAMMAGCGGGGGDGGTTTNSSANSGANQSGGAGGFVEYSPSQATLAAKRTNSTLKFDATGSAVTATDDCGKPLTNTVVYEQTHTVTFAAAGVSEKEHQEVAEFAEAGVLALRQKFPSLVSSTTGITSNKKVYVCVQPQLVVGGAVASASPLIGTNFGGIVLVSSASVIFAGNRARSSMTGTGLTQQAFYQGTPTHEMSHLVEQNSFGFDNDTWFSEGLAEYVAFGKSTIDKNILLSKLAAQNPVTLAWPGSDTSGRAKLNDYSVASATIAYLLSPNGANNSLDTVVSLLNKIKTDSAGFLANCRIVPRPAGCDAASFQVAFSAYFVTAFEATFKEKDGTPMKLRSGANNLQETLTARLTAFWQ
jgi:hypothetical protein